VTEAPLHVFFLVRSLQRGGGERQLATLALGLAAQGVRVTVAVMYGGGALERDLAGAAGVAVVHLRKRGRWDVPVVAGRLLQAVRRTGPGVIYGFMPGANELALLAGRLAGVRVVWGIRSANVPWGSYDWLPHALFRLGARLSRLPDLIIANSEAGRAHHVEAGYDGRRMIVIPNGIDSNRWRPDPAAGAALRRAWRVPAAAPLVGLVARLDPMKDHATFLAAVRASSVPALHAACIGDGDVGAVQALAAELGLADRVHVVGPTDDVRAAYGALDLLVSSSLGEGFSNVIGEAMACGVPCVVTDVGDSARIVGSLGEVVPARDPVAMAAAIDRLWTRRGPGLSEACRARIVTEFGVEALVRRTRERLEALA
jgi:glycosyltransferase involved in cell wall biosynthesis